MLKRSRVGALLFVVLCLGHWSVSAAPVRYRLIVRVISDDRREAIPGARVKTEWGYSTNPKEMAGAQYATTDQSGRVFEIYEMSEWRSYYKFHITVEHADFAASETTIPVPSTAGDVNVSVSLSRKVDRRVVTVSVIGASDHQAVPDARISLEGAQSGELYSGSTDPSGRALISVTEADTYVVRVSHTGFATLQTKLTVGKLAGDPAGYTLNLTLTRSENEKPYERRVRVIVKSRNDKGEEIPVHYASVSTPTETKTSDYEGTAVVAHVVPPGEQGQVTVEASHYKPGSGTFIAGTAFRGEDRVTIWLEPEGKETGDTRFVGDWKCVCKVTISLKADHTGAWKDARGGPPGSKQESGEFPGTWSASGDSVTLNMPIPKDKPNRGGSVTFSLRDGKLVDPWGAVYAKG